LQDSTLGPAAANPYEAAHDDRPLGRMVAFYHKLDVAPLN
jgi:hypothetical protein